jgi:hypothetical protein
MARFLTDKLRHQRGRAQCETWSEIDSSSCRCWAKIKWRNLGLWDTLTVMTRHPVRRSYVRRTSHSRLSRLLRPDGDRSTARDISASHQIGRFSLVLGRLARADEFK